MLRFQLVVWQWPSQKGLESYFILSPWKINAAIRQYLPLLIDKVEKICEEIGLRNDSIVMRMTGCPNGCARPYVAGTSFSSAMPVDTDYPVIEIAFVGKAPGTYAMLLGGGYYGQRLNKIYRG